VSASSGAGGDEDGMLVIPDEPGLGIEIDMDALREKAAGHEDYGE